MSCDRRKGPEGRTTFFFGGPGVFPPHGIDRGDLFGKGPFGGSPGKAPFGKTE